MAERTANPQKPRIFNDVEAANRYEYLVNLGTKIFEGSALVSPGREITPSELALIDKFHAEASPVNPLRPWRLTPAFKVKTPEEAKELSEQGLIVDTSTYSNWEDPGDPLEHIILATKSGVLITRAIQANLKPSVHEQSLADFNPFFVSAAAAFHDDGRLVTHLPSNGPIGKRMLDRMGIRRDITGIIPDEDIYFQVPESESMDAHILSLDPAMVIVALSDNFGKRFPGTNRLFMPSDLTTEKMKAWGEGYAKRPQSGRPSQRHFVEGLPFHIQNEDRVFLGFNNWLKTVSNLELVQVAQMLNEKLAHTLREV